MQRHTRLKLAAPLPIMRRQHCGRLRTLNAYPHLFTPLRVAGLTLANRIVMGSMHTRLETEPDAAGRLAAFYAERVRGGAALVITGGVAPNAAGRLEPDSAVLAEPADVASHRAVVAAVHQAGAPICLQILHAGRYARIAEPVGASAIPSRINRRTVRALTDAEIEQTIDDFVRCALLAREAGYDGVEVMGSEGYLITQFTCPRTNERSDDWGGSLANRLRLPVEIVRRIRARLGADFVVAFRISALDLVAGGLTAAEVADQARAIEAAGADLLDTGIGWHEARVPTIGYMVPRAAWAFAVQRLRAAVSIPVMATNRINTPQLAEELLAGGVADLVALARPLLADPDFAAKARAGRAEEINTCVACNQACLDYIFRDRPATCLVNPRAGRESSRPTNPAPAHRRECGRRIAVVGAGAAGLACALSASGRGHRVTLFEARRAIGGQLNLATVVPGKEFAETLRYFAAHVAASDIELRLAASPSARELAAGGFDVVVIATGVTPRMPAIEGIDHPCVARYDEVLAGARTAGPRVAVIGAGGVGFDVAAYLSQPAATNDRDRDSPDDATRAEFFATWGIDASGKSAGGLTSRRPAPARRAVTVFQRSTTAPGRTLGLTTGWAIRAELVARGVRFLSGVDYRRIDDRGLHYEHEGQTRVLAADTVVVCAGQLALRSLHDELAALGVSAHLIGGARCTAELDALRAIDEGTRLAAAL